MTEWLTREQALERLNVRPQTLYAYVSRGRIGMKPDDADPRRFVFVEMWENAQSHARHHNEGPHILAFQARDQDAVEKVDVYRLTQIA